MKSFQALLTAQSTRSEIETYEAFSEHNKLLYHLL